MTTGSHYTVLARRFRPQAFDDVVGQEHVSLALRNAIRAGRVAHAYLFTGARGVGKTSTARILAKALNCPHVKDGVPCNECEICEGITSGNDVDVLEIDGASNRGIDDIRSLRANVGVRSMRTQYKVYIIDEVHMLTREAFNALLKTLEEPPPNVKFVFCTTEPGKVPDTILSRCQRFDFSAIGEQSIARRLGEIAEAEGFQVDDDALDLVARRARGSMRDSQSLFDQLLAFSDGTVRADDVHRMLGTASDERLVELFDAVAEHRPGEVLNLLEVSLHGGVQAVELMEQSIGYVRDMMVILSGGSQVPLCSVSGRFREALQVQAARLGMHSIMAAFQILADARNQMFRSTFGRTILEMALVQLSLLENLTAISDLLSGRLPELPALPAPGTGTGTAGPAPSGVSTSSRNSPDPDASSSAAASSAPGSSAEKKNAETGRNVSRLTAADAQPLNPEPSDVSRLDPTEVQGAESEAAEYPAETDDSESSESDESDDRSHRETPRDSVSSAARGIPASKAELELSEHNCERLLKRLIERLPLSVSAGLRQAAGLAFSETQRQVDVLLDATWEHARQALETPTTRAAIEQMIQELTGIEVTVAVRPVIRAETTASRTSAPTGSAPPAPAVTREALRRPVTPELRPRPASPEPHVAAAPVNLIGEVDPSRDDFVRHVLETFGATVVRVMPTPASAPSADAQSEAEE